MQVKNIAIGILIIVVIMALFKKHGPVDTVENFTSRPMLVDGIYAIKGGREGKWCADEGWKVVCNRNQIGPWERFHLRNLGNNQIMLSGGRSNGKKVCRIRYVWWEGSFKWLMSCGYGGRPDADKRREIWGDGERMAYNDEKLQISNSPQSSHWKNIKARYGGNYMADDYHRTWYGNQKYMNANRPWRWGWERFQFVLIEAAGERSTFCPDPKFLEFNPTACKNPWSGWSCERSAKKGWKASQAQCITRLDKAMMKNSYENEDFFKLIWQAREVTENNIKKMRTVGSNERSDSDAKKTCWIRMPTGCSNNLGETPNIDERRMGKKDTGWIQSGRRWRWDGTDAGCHGERKKAFNDYCRRNDAMSRVSANNPSQLSLAPKAEGQSYHSNLTYTRNTREFLTNQTNWLAHLKKFMLELYKLGCMINGMQDDYFDNETCKRTRLENITDDKWFDTLSSAHKVCKEAKTKSNNYLCKQFKQHMAIVIDIAHKMIYMSNEVTNKCRNSSRFGKLLSAAPC